MFAFEHVKSGDIMVQKAPACTIKVLAQAVKELFNVDNPIKIIGVRHGEKMHETLLSAQEHQVAIDLGEFYRVPADNRDLNYDKYFIEGDNEIPNIEEFNSYNTRILNVDEVKEKLLSLKYIRKELENWSEKNESISNRSERVYS